MKKIVNISIDRIKAHPDNPRKDVGDVTELADSIKKNGIMQNLTVIPECAITEEPDNQPNADDILQTSEFYALIGHRRLAAAKMAGLTEVPCIIRSKISKKEQVGIMLEENMQRNDLTIYEQAQGFQMMLDLGETEETIAKKTGFSKQTIKHRLNLAKLDQEELHKKEQSDTFQLSLTDLYALEQVHDIETRNKLLREAQSSRDLIWKAQNAAKAEVRRDKFEKFKALLEAAEIEKAPDSAQQEMYSNKWTTVKEWDLDEEDVPDDLGLEDVVMNGEKVLWLPYYDRKLKLIKRVKKEKKEESPEEIERRKKREEQKRLSDILKNMHIRKREFVLNIITGKIAPLKNPEKVIAELWGIIASSTMYTISASRMYEFLSGKSSYYLCSEEEKENLDKQIKDMSTLHQMLIAVSEEIGRFQELWTYCNYEYVESKGEPMVRYFNLLKEYGWSFEGEEEQIVNGTHEFYDKVKDLEEAEEVA